MILESIGPQSKSQIYQIHISQWNWVNHYSEMGAMASHDCLLNRLFGRRSKKTSKLRVTDFCAGNSPATGELPAQRASNAENVSIWWRHHASLRFSLPGIEPCQCLNGGFCPDPQQPTRCECRQGFYGTLCESSKYHKSWHFAPPFPS